MSKSMRVIQLLLVCILGSTTWANAATDATVNPPTFASETFYNEPYSLGLTADEGLSIYITSDGSEPVDANGKLSASAFPYNPNTKYQIGGTYKAVTVDADGNCSEVVSETFTYFGGVTPPYYDNFDASKVTLVNFTLGVKNNTSFFWLNRYCPWILGG